ncbi:hypothetical protein [Aquibacillus sediminis]|uniref:hypothetical protein n=1 Tax=Aquibacillus sediminis TaxID=2574734 RepID=UPI0011087506|nr:hypothetical protein [Aquibacillus sediminis]
MKKKDLNEIAVAKLFYWLSLYRRGAYGSHLLRVGMVVNIVATLINSYGNGSGEVQSKDFGFVSFIGSLELSLVLVLT